MIKTKMFMIIIVLAIFSIIGSVSAANLTVSPGGSIQEAVNNASSGDIIIVNDNNGSTYTYTENVVINKKVSLQSKNGSNVTVQAANPSNSVFTINSEANGSCINGFIIKGATNGAGILLNSVMNCTIHNNTIYDNNYGINIFDSSFNNITQNLIKENNHGLYLVTQCISLEDFCGEEIEWYEEEDYYCYYEYSGIHSDSQGNIIKGNSFTTNTYGLFLKSDECWSSLTGYDNYVLENNIAGNSYGIFAEGVYIWASEVAHVHFNRIENNTLFGIYLNKIGVNATNNWWGSSNSPTISSSNNSDIRPYDDPCYYYSPWLVLGVNANPTNISGRESVITADLTRNSNNNDTSSQGHLPDGIPVNFTTNLGTVISPVYTRNGKANSTFNRGTINSGTAHITATLDNQSLQTNIIIIADTTNPAVTASIAGGIYNTGKSVTLTASDNLDVNPVVYYSLNNGTTWNNQPKTLTLTLTQGITNLKFYARDSAGNTCTNQTITYTIDTTAPTVTANLASGNYNPTQSVTLTATDNLDPNPAIYYTIDGSNPTNQSTMYTGPINIVNTTILRFIAQDNAGNQAVIQTRNYALTLPIINVNTGHLYSAIQTAIDDPLTLNGHTIEVLAGTFKENIIVNKTLIILAVAGNNVTVQALNPSIPVFTIYSEGNGSCINGFIISGAINSVGIFLNSVMNCTIQNNTIYGNNYGIDVFDSSFNNITRNIVKQNNYGLYLLTQCITLAEFSGSAYDYHFLYECVGVHSDSQGNIIKGNSFTNNYYGLYLQSDEFESNLTEYNNHVLENNIAGNSYGIYAEGGIMLMAEIAKVYFNRIENNTLFGVYLLEIGLDARNNWWGSSTEPTVSYQTNSDICPAEVEWCDYDPWIVLNITSHDTVSHDSSSDVIADLTHNSQGIDTSSNGTVPNGIFINFTTTLGSINGSVPIINGKSVANFNSGLASGTATVSATLDAQTVSKTIINVVGAYNQRTKKTFTTIQAAIDDTTTLNGDTLLVGGGTYTENVVVDKQVILMSAYGKNVTVQPMNFSQPAFTVYSSGSTIKGFTIKGSTNYGIFLYQVNNCNITGNTITNCSGGIYLYYSNNTNITGNNATNNTENGINLYYSNGNMISGNNLESNGLNGIYIDHTNNNTISGNNATKNTLKGIYVDNSKTTTIIRNNATNNKQIGILINNSNSTWISENNINNNICENIGGGLVLIDTNNTTISANNLTNNTNYGLLLINSKNNTLTRNNITNNIIGIQLQNATNNTISLNNVTSNIQDGIMLLYSGNIILSGNNITNNLNNGIYLDNSDGTEITENTITNNIANGIILLNSNNNTISLNSVKNNSKGIMLHNASNNTISMNNATDNIDDGILLYYSSNCIINENIIKNNPNTGIYLDNSDNTEITENTITNNHCGLYLHLSPACVNFNRITGNNIFGLWNDYSSFVNATNNWWGTNNPTVSSSNSSDIYILGGNIIYTPWIVLNVNSTYISDGISNITADLTYNNQGTNTLFLGHIPNGINVNFITNYGTIQQTAQIINGKTISQLNYSPPHSTANITVTLDNQIISKTVNLFKVYNTVTQEGFATIQAAIDDSSTSDGDIIEVASGSYLENVIINKMLTIRAVPGATVIVQALNPNLPVFTITSTGSGSTISGFIVNGTNNTTGIFLENADGCTIENNNINGNYQGIYLLQSSSNTVINNIISNNNYGIFIPAECEEYFQSISLNNIISNNIVKNNYYGIYLWGDYSGISSIGGMNINDTCIISNIISGNIYGVYSNSSPFNMHLNQLSNNFIADLWLEVFEGVSFDARNNWWGSNQILMDYSFEDENLPTVPMDIFCKGANENWYVNDAIRFVTPWLILNVNANTTNVTNNSTITADLTHNSNGDNTSSQGHIPDDIPVNFTTNLGTITSPAFTKNGKAVLTFNTGTTTSGIATITTKLDDQSLELNVTIDKIVPTVNATLDSGLYNTTQSANLTASDNFDPHPIIYYTTNGSTPTLSSSIYTAPITITTTTTLKFMAVDFTGNQSPLSTLYYIFAPVGNLNTGKGYSSIQNAINDNLTLNGHVIVVGNGTYTENILVNKNLTIMPYDGNVTIQAANPNNPVITVNSGGSESAILGFIIKGATSTSSAGLYLNQANNCTLTGNILTNNYYGLLLTSSQDNMIWDNNLTGNLMDAIRLNSSNNNTIYSNTITNNNGTGIYLANSLYTLIMANTIQNNILNGIELNISNNATIYENAITTNHQSGIKATSSSADIHFNIITENTIYGLYNLGNGTINATNNWWGTNNLTVSSASPSNIYIAGGVVTYDPWLVFGLTGSTITVTHNGTSDSEITADLTHDNHGGDASGSGSIPDGLPVNFTTTLGAINSTGTVRSGKAKVTLTSSPSSGATTVTAILGNYSVSKMFHKSFSTIQAAVTDSLTVDGDVILVTNGTYTENIVINKNLTVVSGGNVTVQASNPSSPVFTVNNCSGVVIYGFTIVGATNSSAIYLNTVNNCQILSNTITGNGVQLVNATSAFGYGIFLNSANNCTVSGNILQNNLGGIDLEYSNNTLVSGNNVTGSTFRGVYLYQANNTTITESNLASNDCGILSSYSNHLKVTGNDIKNNTYQGIYLYYSSGDLHFNRIVGNGQYGLLSRGGTVNATNNWWGTNNPVVSSVQPSAIYVISGSVLYNPRLVLTITPTSYKVADGKVYEATITADLNHNSNNEDLSTVIYTPEGIPVTFTSNNNSNITSTSYTEDGKASATLILNPNLQSGFTNVTATLDGQSASVLVDRVAKATIIISSTAIDLSTNDFLYLTYEMPLNESVSWLSVLWKSTSSDFGSFQNEVDLIVNGVVVLNRTVSNINYLINHDSVSQKVWYNVNFLNWLFSESEASKMALQSIIYLNPGLQNLTGSALEAGLLNMIREKNGFNDSEMFIIANYEYFKDNITTIISYPGDAGKKISFEDPDSGEVVGINLPGNPIFRESTMIYANGGYFHVDDRNDPTSRVYKNEGYEGVRSFAIVTTKVTDEMLQYWLDEKDRTNANGTLLYPEGPMKAAYGTFLESLLVIKCHDMVADAAANKYNVTWSRTTPIVVSVCDDAYATYITGEMDHRMGMDAVGDAENVKAFCYACSSSFSAIEYWVGSALFPSDNPASNLLGSVTLGLGYKMFNGEPLEIFESNGYTIIRAVGDNQRILIIDPATGLVMDAGSIDLNDTISGTRCYGDQQTEWATDLAESILGLGIPFLDILNGGNGIDFSLFANNTKNGLTGFINSAIISLTSGNILLNYGVSILNQFLGIEMVALAMANAYGTHKDGSPYILYYEDLSPEQAIKGYIYGFDNAQYNWHNCDVSRLGHKTDIIFVECDVTYFDYNENKYKTETQYWTMLPEPLAFFTEGNSHTFTYNLPGQNSRSEHAHTHITAHCVAPSGLTGRITYFYANYSPIGSVEGPIKPIYY